MGQGRMDTERLIRAFRYAATLHAGDLRKGTTIPYLSHLMGVASIVQQYGGDEDQVIAALLHDAIEDHPRGGETRQEIGAGFGARVMTMVEACTDSDTEQKPEWFERKERYLKHLHEAPPEAMLISLADKVHNARAILADHRQIGEEIWARFNAPKELTLWYYRALANTFNSFASEAAKPELGPLAEELERVVSEVERRANQAWSAGGAAAAGPGVTDPCEP